MVINIPTDIESGHLPGPIPFSNTSKLFERSGAEVRIEPLTVNRNGLELPQIRSSGYLVVLVALISLQRTEFDPFGAVLEKIRVVVCVLGRNQHDVHVGPIGRLEVGQPKDQPSISLPVNRGA